MFLGYNFIMLKLLRRIDVGILTWIVGCAVVGAAIVFMASKQHTAAAENEAAREKRCAVTFSSDPKKQDACEHERDSGLNYLSWWYVLFTWPDGITTWAIIGTGFVIGWQSWETRRSVQASREEFIATQRPKVSVRTFFFSQPKSTFGDEPNGILAGSILTGQFYIVNLGGTRATVKEIHYEFYPSRTQKLPAKRPWEGKEGVKCEVVLEPGQSRPQSFGRYEPLSSGEAFNLFSGQSFIYLMGFILYVDGLGIGRATRFCRLYDPNSDRFVAVNDVEYESAD